MKQQRIKVGKIKTKENLTQSLFIYKGYEEYNDYFNPWLRNRTEQLMRSYLYQRFQDHSKE